MSLHIFIRYNKKIPLTPNNSRYRTLNECISIKKRIKLKYMSIEDSLSDY